MTTNIEELAEENVKEVLKTVFGKVAKYSKTGKLQYVVTVDAGSAAAKRLEKKWLDNASLEGNFKLVFIEDTMDAVLTFAEFETKNAGYLAEVLMDEVKIEYSRHSISNLKIKFSMKYVKEWSR